jgi:hypothetical protein
MVAMVQISMKGLYKKQTAGLKASGYRFGIAEF